MFWSFEFASYFGFTNSYTFRNWACRKQSVVWSLTIPTACMNAQVIVGPTKLNPRSFKSLLIISDFSVLAGSSLKFQIP